MTWWLTYFIYQFRYFMNQFETYFRLNIDKSIKFSCDRVLKFKFDKQMPSQNKWDTSKLELLDDSTWFSSFSSTWVKSVNSLVLTTLWVGCWCLPKWNGYWLNETYNDQVGDTRSDIDLIVGKFSFFSAWWWALSAVAKLLESIWIEQFFIIEQHFDSIQIGIMT